MNNFGFVSNADCLQGRCANATTGCKDVCWLKTPAFHLYTIPMPKSADEAVGMLNLAHIWLTQNAPDRLKSTPTIAPDTGELAKLRDTERLDFVLANTAFICRIDPTMVQLMTQDEDEEYIALSGEGEAFRTEREAIDAAIGIAALAPIAQQKEPT